MATIVILSSKSLIAKPQGSKVNHPSHDFISVFLNIFRGRRRLQMLPNDSLGPRENVHRPHKAD